MNIVIHSPDPLVFRDGRPFGDSGHVHGGMLRWPWPSTVVGMLRSRIALHRDPDYFYTKDGNKVPDQKIKEIQAITATRVFPLWRKKEDNSIWEYLFPAPADALLTGKAEKNGYQVHSFQYQDPFDQGGVDLPWRNWKLPLADTLEKPASDCPELWFQDNFFSWLKHNQINGTISAKKLGLPWPQPEIRMHTAIDAATGTVKTGQLFSSQGIRLTTAENEQQRAGRFGIGVKLENLQNSDTPCGPCYFGGERRVAFVEQLNQPFPTCPDWFKNRQFLRLILFTPGDFGSWAPSWLMPDRNKTETSWQDVPGTNILIRLCSAFIPRWQPASGWDYVTQAPKATRKLVPAGAVYVVELKDPAQSETLAKKIWGRSMDTALSDANGYGAVCVGNIPSKHLCKSST